MIALGVLLWFSPANGRETTVLNIPHPARMAEGLHPIIVVVSSFSYQIPEALIQAGDYH